MNVIRNLLLFAWLLLSMLVTFGVIFNLGWNAHNIQPSEQGWMLLALLTSSLSLVAFLEAWWPRRWSDNEADSRLKRVAVFLAVLNGLAVVIATATHTPPDIYLYAGGWVIGLAATALAISLAPQR